MYRMTVLKQGLARLHTPMTDTIKGCGFITDMIPLEEGISAEYFVSHPVDLLLIDLCKNPRLGLSLLKQLRILGAKSEIVAYIAEGDCDTLRRVLRLGVADCLVDPFDTNRFEQAVDANLGKVGAAHDFNDDFHIIVIDDVGKVVGHVNRFRKTGILIFVDIPHENIFNCQMRIQLFFNEVAVHPEQFDDSFTDSAAAEKRD